MTTTTENIYVGDGSTVLYSFTFPYINEADVKVSLNKLNVLTYTLANATTVEFNTAPPAGTTIRIYRATPVDAVTAEFYPGSAIRAQDLNGNFEQTLFLVQESKTIIDNSDAASVVGIATEALSTANQASATADAVAGVANDALNTATVADGKAVQAGIDAAIANNAAIVAKAVADNAIGVNESLGAETSNVLIWNGSNWVPGAQTGGPGPGGGGTGTPTNTNIFGTAKAIGYIENDGSIFSEVNVASVVGLGSGYRVTFKEPMANANYTVVGSLDIDVINGFFEYADATVDGFTYYAFDYGTGAVGVCRVSFAVYDDQPAEVALTTFGDVINYSGVAAWGEFAGNASLNDGLNVDSVTRTAPGNYEVVFTTPLPSANYSVNASTVFAGEALVGLCTTQNHTATGFEIRSFTITGTDGDYGINFSINALNALPPKGGTGTDAWATVDSSANIYSSFNIASCIETGPGTFEYVFTTPMPTANYAVSVTSNDLGSAGEIRAYNKLTTGFTVFGSTSNGTAPLALAHSVVVHATNATLPLSFNAEQIESAINNPGASAWGKIDADGVLEGGLNIASVTKTGTGVYDVVFTTALSNADYSLVGSVARDSGAACRFKNQSATGFSVAMTSYTSTPENQPFSFTVFSTNAIPPRGGTGTDAWGSVAADGTLESSFNIASIIKLGVGAYEAVFTTPMPTDTYGLQVTPYSTTQGLVFTASGFAKTTTGFKWYTQKDFGTSNAYEDCAVGFTVNATNATLPTSFTEAQIQSVLDFIAVANPAGVAKAWGNAASDGTLGTNLNIASVTKTGTGFYDVVFTTPMSDANYSVTATGLIENSVVNVDSFTATGFRAITQSASTAAYTDGPFSFTVYSN